MLISIIVHSIYLAKKQHPWSKPWKVDTSNMTVDELNLEKKRKTDFIILLVLFIIEFLLSIIAVVIAMGCNLDKKKRFLISALAFVFPEIYIGQHAYRRYIRYEPAYCSTKNELVLAFKPPKEENDLSEFYDE